MEEHRYFSGRGGKRVLRMEMTGLTSRSTRDRLGRRGHLQR